jgi:hypothetical protein
MEESEGKKPTVSYSVSSSESNESRGAWRGSVGIVKGLLDSDFGVSGATKKRSKKKRKRKRKKILIKIC